MGACLIGLPAVQKVQALMSNMHEMFSVQLPSYVVVGVQLCIGHNRLTS